MSSIRKASEIIQYAAASLTAAVDSIEWEHL